MDSPTIRRAIGAFVRAARQMQRLTQDQLATLSLGRPWQISRAAISAIERGRNLPSLPALAALHRILHIDPVDVLERTGVRVPTGLEIAAETSDTLSERAARLVRIGDHRGALELYDAMLGRRGAATRVIELRRAAALLHCGALGAGRAAAERAITLSDGDASIRAEAYALLSGLQLRMGSVPLAADAADRAAALSAGCDVRVQMLASWAEARCRFEQERYADAVDAFARARENAREAPDPHHVILATGSMGLCCLKLGQRRQGRTWLEEAVGLARKHAEPALEAGWLVDLGRTALEDGRLEEADRLAIGAVALGKPRERWATVVRAEWLRHRVFIARHPEQVDRHRLGSLRRLLPRIDPLDLDETIQEVRRAVLV